MQHGENAIYEIQTLNKRGVYLQKGELAVVTLNYDGIIEGEVNFRPNIADIPMLL